MIKEIWKPIPGYEEIYEVSSYGRVRSLDRTILQSSSKGTFYECFKRGVLLRPGKMNRFGHLSVALGRNNSQTVHSLVLRAFIGSRPLKHDVAHKDGDGSNNRLDNLRYATRSDNNLDISRLNRRKLKHHQIFEIREHTLRTKRIAEELAEKYNCSRSNIYRIWREECWSHLK